VIICQELRAMTPQFAIACYRITAEFGDGGMG
jgi:hypothetical protein